MPETEIGEEEFETAEKPEKEEIRLLLLYCKS
jgi:hypothetical protein